MFLCGQREFEMLTILKDHKNIVNGVEYIEERERCRGFIVMEKVIGDNILTNVL